MADLHVTRHARETEYEKRIYNTLNKPLEELNYVTSLNRDYRPKAISEHSFFYIPLRIHRWICPGKAKDRRTLPNSNISQISRDEK